MKLYLINDLLSKNIIHFNFKNLYELFKYVQAICFQYLKFKLIPFLIIFT